MSEASRWQKGPKFLEQEIAEWPIKSEVDISSIPELKVVNNKVKGNVIIESLASRIDLRRFSNWERLKATTARILKLYSRFAKGGNKNDKDITVENCQSAEDFWIKEAQPELVSKLKETKFIKLNPQFNEKGIVVVGGRTERWMEGTWNRQRFILLPKGHTISELIIRHEHIKCGHMGAYGTIVLET